MSHRLTITLPDKIYKQLKKKADAHLRSLSNQIIFELTNQPPVLTKPTPIIMPNPELPSSPYKITVQADSHISPIPTPAQAVRPIPKPEPTNEYYKQIKKGYRTLYGEKSPELEELLTLATNPDIEAFLRTQHRSDIEQIITNSYDHTLSPAQFQELLTYIDRGPRRLHNLKSKETGRVIHPNQSHFSLYMPAGHPATLLFTSS
jgi:hypothetical protein